MKAEEDVTGSVCSDPHGVSAPKRIQEASDFLQNDSDPDWSQHESIAPTVVDTTDVPIVDSPDESAPQAHVSPVSALFLSPVATCSSAQPRIFFFLSDGPAHDEVIFRSFLLNGPPHPILTLNPGLLFYGPILQSWDLLPLDHCPIPYPRPGSSPGSPSRPSLCPLLLLLLLLPLRGPCPPSLLPLVILLLVLPRVRSVSSVVLPRPVLLVPEAVSSSSSRSP